MNIIYFNFVPEKITNEEIEELLHRFVDLLPIGVVSITSGEDLIDYMERVLDFYCSSDKDGISNIDSFLKIFPEFSSVDEVKKKQIYLGENEPSAYKLLKDGFDKGVNLKNCKIVVVSGDKYDISAPYGVAVGNVCINRCLEEKSIWHETAHLFGVSDHYDENTHATICGDKRCFMQWDALSGDHFCKKALSEIAV